MKKVFLLLIVLQYGFFANAQLDKWMKTAQGLGPKDNGEDVKEITEFVSKMELITSAGNSTSINDGEQKIIFRCYVTKDAVAATTQSNYVFEGKINGLPDMNEPYLVFGKNEETSSWDDITSKGYLDINVSPSQNQELKNMLDDFDYKLKGTYTIEARLFGLKSKVNPVKGVVTSSVIFSQGNFSLNLKGSAGAYAAGESEETVASFNTGYHSNKINDPSAAQKIADYFKANYKKTVTHVSLSTETLKSSGTIRRLDVYVVHSADSNGDCGWLGAFVDFNKAGQIVNCMVEGGDAIACDAVPKIKKNVN